MSSGTGLLPVLARGTYVAREVDSGLHVACDRFRIDPCAGGLRLTSEQIPFGPPAPRQRAVFHLDADWTPQHLEVEGSDGSALCIEFHDTRADLRTRSTGPWRELSVPVPRREALVLLRGSLWGPLHAVRRMPPDAPGSVRFRLVPEGSCRLRPGDARAEAGNRQPTLLMDLQAYGTEDRLHLLLDAAGNVVRFRARNRNLLVVLEADPC